MVNLKMSVEFYKRIIYYLEIIIYIFFLLWGIFSYNCIDGLEKMQRLIWKDSFWCGRSMKTRLPII